MTEQRSIGKKISEEDGIAWLTLNRRRKKMR